MTKRIQDNAFTLSFQVLLKDSIRNETLENLNGSIETKKELRHSHYATQKIFGPLSAKFEPFVQPSSHSHRNYLLFPKHGNYAKGKSGSGYGINYSRNSGYSGQQKRASSSSWDTSRNKRARQGEESDREGQLLQDRAEDLPLILILESQKIAS